jgi:hypothetical protein
MPRVRPMSDRHTIVVRVKGGKVIEVLFCDCCPALTLEVRTYTDSTRAAASARPAWHMVGGDTRPSAFKRDERGIYEAMYHESETDDA